MDKVFVALKPSKDRSVQDPYISQCMGTVRFTIYLFLPFFIF